MKRFFLFLAILYFFTACVKGPVDTGGVLAKAISLNNTAAGSVNLSWDEVNVSTFRAYIVIRSSTPTKVFESIDEIPTNLIVRRITDYQDRSFIDSVDIQSSYFRVVADIGSRLLNSNEVFLKMPVQFLDEAHYISLARYDEALNRILLVDNATNRLILSVNLEKESYYYSQFQNNPKFKSFGYGSPGFGPEVFIPNTSYLSIFDGNSLELKDTINTVDCSAIDVGTDSLLFYSSNSKNKIVAINRKTKRAQFEFGRGIATDNLKKVQNSNEVIRVRNTSTAANMDYFHFDPASGKVLDSVYNKLAIGSNFIDGTRVTFSKSGAYFLAGLAGITDLLVANKKLERIGYLDTPLHFEGGVTFAAITPDENHIILATNAFTTSIGEIVVYSGVAPFKELKRMNSKLINIQTITADNEHVFVVGLAKHPFFSQNVTAIETLSIK